MIRTIKSEKGHLMKLFVAVVVLVVCLALPAGGDLYTWVDANGVKHFSNEPPPGVQDAARKAEVKHSSKQYEKWEEQRKSSQTKMLEENRADDDASKNESAAGRQVTERPGGVVMYTKPKCGYCARAKAFFAKYGIAYTEYDITTDKQARKRFKKLNGNGVPLIFVGEKRVPGFNEGLLRGLLGIK
jgi:glutaredoxin